MKKQIPDEIIKKYYKKDVSNLLFSKQLELKQRQLELELRAKDRLEDVVCNFRFNAMKYLAMSNKGLSISQTYENMYFNIIFQTEFIQKNILTNVGYVHIYVNGYIKTYYFNEFQNLDYIDFISDLLQLDEYKFMFLKPLYQNALKIQECFI